MTPGRIPADALAHAVDQLRHSGSSIVSEGNEFWGFPRIDVQKVFLAEAAYRAAPNEGERLPDGVMLAQVWHLVNSLTNRTDLEMVCGICRATYSALKKAVEAQKGV